MGYFSRVHSVLEWTSGMEAGSGRNCSTGSSCADGRIYFEVRGKSAHSRLGLGATRASGLIDERTNCRKRKTILNAFFDLLGERGNTREETSQNVHTPGRSESFRFACFVP